MFGSRHATHSSSIDAQVLYIKYIVIIVYSLCKPAHFIIRSGIFTIHDIIQFYLNH